MEIGDPRASNYGRARYGQLAPNPTAKLAQQRVDNSAPAAPQGPMGSPMMSALQQPPEPKAQPPRQPAKQMAAVGTFGPKTFTQNLPTRGQTDFGKGGWQGGINALHSTINKGPTWLETATVNPFGIGRRAAGSENDLSVDNAKTALQRAYQSRMGRDASEEELMSQLQGQGLKPGDRWVGQNGLNSIINSLQGDHEPIRLMEEQSKTVDFNQPSMQPDMRPSGFDLERARRDINTLGPMQSSLESNPAQSAYQEYLGEFGPDDQEAPVPFEVFQQAFDQMPQESAMATGLWNPQTREAVTNEQGRFGWNNINLNPVNQAGGSRFEGFNDDRALAGEDTKSVKDTFRRVVGGLGIDLSQFKTFDEVEGMLKSQVAPALQQAGINVLDVQKDKILVETFERGPEWIDVVGDATGMDPRWWWGDEGGGSKSMVTPSQGPINPMDFLGQSSSRSGQEENPTQSALMSSLGFGEGGWQTFLDMLLKEV